MAPPKLWQKAHACITAVNAELVQFESGGNASDNCVCGTAAAVIAVSQRLYEHQTLACTSFWRLQHPHCQAEPMKQPLSVYVGVLHAVSLRCCACIRSRSSFFSLQHCHQHLQLFAASSDHLFACSMALQLSHWFHRVSSGYSQLSNLLLCTSAVQTVPRQTQCLWEGHQDDHRWPSPKANPAAWQYHCHRYHQPAHNRCMHSGKNQSINMQKPNAGGLQ